MLKLLLCILCGGILAMMLLQLRQQRLNLAYQTNQIHNQIEATQAQLWKQQLSIAACTSPNAIAGTVQGHDLHLVTLKATPQGNSWMAHEGAN